MFLCFGTRVFVQCSVCCNIGCRGGYEKLKQLGAALKIIFLLLRISPHPAPLLLRHVLEAEEYKYVGRAGTARFDAEQG